MKRRDKKGRILQTGERQRSDGMFEFRITKAGKRYSAYGHSLPEMRENKEKLLMHLEVGIDIDKQRIALNDFADTYLAMKEKTVAKSTYSTMKYMYDKYVREDIGIHAIADIKRSHVKNFYLSLMVGKGLSISTIARIDCFLTPIFEMALNDDVILRNPGRGVCTEIKRETHAKPKEVNVPTPEEEKRLMDYIRENPFYSCTMKNLIITICGTGMRVGEATALTWDCVDLTNGIIKVNKSVAYVRDNLGRAGQMIKEPKTEAGKRSIPMIKAVREALEEELEYQGKEKPEQPVIDGVTGFCFLSSHNRPYTREAVWAQIRRMTMDYNQQLDNKRDRIKYFSTHALRHTFATALCQSTDDLKAIQEIMGHSDASMTLTIYAKATEESKACSMVKFEDKIGL